MSAPLRPGDLTTCLERLDAGMPFMHAFEMALRELPADIADRWMLIHRESRGSWHLLLGTDSGRALFIGNALSGGWVALGINGFDVVIVDQDPERLRFAAHRGKEHAPGRVKTVRGQGGARLPFEDQSFDLVILEEAEHLGSRIEELQRVCRGEIVVTAENRLAYKRSNRQRGDFSVVKPWTWMRRAFFPEGGAQTLRGYRRTLRDAAFEDPRSYALYPHIRDFTHVVALDGKDEPKPELPIGPMEKKNRVKLVGKALGLFPVLTPSFALLSKRRTESSKGPRVLRVLNAVAKHLDEPRPVVEHWTATRANSIVLLTRTESEEADPRGRWAFHFGLSTKENIEIERHAHFLRFVKERFPDHPTPELLFEGEMEGLRFTCERRIGGISAPQLTGRHDCSARLFADVARAYSRVVTEAPRAMGEPELRTLVDEKFALAARSATHPKSMERLKRTQVEFRERLGGEVIPLVFYHADLRSKHIRVNPDGSVVGYLDLGAGEAADLPYFDLLYLIVHERMHEQNLSAGRVWRLLCQENGLRDYERSALDDYSERLGLTREYRDAIEFAYPVLVAAMAEKNWDYSRPEWLHRHFDF